MPSSPPRVIAAYERLFASLYLLANEREREKWGEWRASAVVFFLTQCLTFWIFGGLGIASLVFGLDVVPSSFLGWLLPYVAVYAVHWWYFGNSSRRSRILASFRASRIPTPWLVLYASLAFAALTFFLFTI